MTRKLLPRAERQASIEQAAARAFGRTGFAATSMDDVADEAGVTKVLVYRHVDSKESLYRSILEQTSTRLREEFEAADAPDPATIAHLATARADGDAYRLLFVHAPNEPEFADYAEDIRAIIAGVADRAFGSDLDPELRLWAIDLVVRFLVQSVLAWLDHGDPDDDAKFVARTAAALTAVVTTLTTTPDS